MKKNKSRVLTAWQTLKSASFPGSDALRPYSSAPRWLILVLTICLSQQVSAQIYYISVDAQTNGHLRRINLNGTGDTAIPLPFTSVSNPYWSRDGAVVALTVVDPRARGQRSTNIFSYNPATGGVTQLTDFTDIFGQNFFSLTFPVYKAFSPNRRALAVFSLVQTRGGSGSSGGSDLPVLEIFTGPGNPIEVLQDSDRSYTTGGDHGGEGVDWSPTQNVLTAPLTTSAPYLSNPSSSGGVTAIYLIAPEANARFTGRLRRVTSPRTDFNINNGTLWAEHDYMPRFSPNGAAIAFVRSFQSLSTTAQTPNPDQQSLHILNLNTGADTQIAGPFPQGVYITTIDWAPNGAALVFDLGLQPNSITGREQHADPRTNQTYFVNTNGSGLRQFLGNNRGEPSWRPTGVPGLGGQKSDFNGDGAPDYVLLNPATRRSAVWFLQNGAFRSGAFGPTLPAGYALASTADINLDGKPDYVMFNPTTRQTAIWFLNGTAFGGGAFGPTLPPGWRLSALPDVNRDSHPDYVLFNPGTRQTAIWFLNRNVLASASLGPTLPAGWTLVDANDFNGDGKPDYVLGNPTTHQTAIWFMNGAARLSAALGPALPPGWTLAGTADFDRDGKADFVLVNSTTRQTAVWHMNGAARTTAAFGPTLPAGYTLASP